MESISSNPAPPTAASRFAVLLFSDIVGSTELKARYGVPAYSAALRTHNGHFERIARDCRRVDLSAIGDHGGGYATLV